MADGGRPCAVNGTAKRALLSVQNARQALETPLEVYSLANLSTTSLKLLTMISAKIASASVPEQNRPHIIVSDTLRKNKLELYTIS